MSRSIPCEFRLILSTAIVIPIVGVLSMVDGTLLEEESELAYEEEADFGWNNSSLLLVFLIGLELLGSSAWF